MDDWMWHWLATCGIALIAFVVGMSFGIDYERRRR